MVAHEWAQTVDDVIWRRSKAGLAMDEAGKARLAAYLTIKLSRSVAPTA
jgi:glycerol-3-phosphate dehydrogenase